MLDDELKADIIRELPKDIPYVFISRWLQKNLQELKDLLWDSLLEENKDK
jgi:GTP-binding protein